MPPTLSAKIDEKEMHTLRISVICFKKVKGKLSIKQGLRNHFNHKSINYFLIPVIVYVILRLAFSEIP